MWASNASRLWECWLPEERPAPNCVRTVRPISAAPPVMNGNFAGSIEQLVQADTEEVEIHDFDDRSHARHGCSHGEPDDRRLRYGCVAYVVAEAFPQAAGEPEHVAALADVDTRHEHALIGLELGFERLADGVHGAPLAGIPGRRRGLGDSRTLPDDEVEEGARRRSGQTPRERDRVIELVRHGLVQPGDLGLANARITQHLAVQQQWVALLPLLQLLLRAIPLWVAFIVTMPAIGGRLDDHGTEAGPCGADCTAHGARRCNDVVAVDRPIRQSVADGPAFERRRMLRGRRREFRVSVVLAEEDHGQFPDRREVERLVEGPLRRGPVAEERNGHTVPTAELRRSRGADGDRKAGRDDAIGPEDPDLGIGDVHRAAPAPVGSFGTTHELGEHPERLESLGQAVSMAAVGGRDDVIGAQRPAGANGRRLLADRQVHEAGDEAVAIELGDPLFEAADQHHATLHLEQFGARDHPGGSLDVHHGRVLY